MHVENRGQRPLLKLLVCSMTILSKVLEMSCSASHVETVSVFVSLAVPATFKVSLKSQEAEEGNSVTLRCELSKKGVPVQWQKEGQVLSEEISRGKYQMKLEGKTALMTILNVRPEDAGKYSCITGDEKTTAELKVKCKFGTFSKMHQSANTKRNFSLEICFGITVYQLNYDI